MKLQFLELWGIDFNPVDECYTFVADRPDNVFYKILGYFFWDGKLPTDGALILSEEQLNTILSHCPTAFRLIKDNIAYTVKKTTQEDLNLLNDFEYTVEIMDIFESEEEDETIYGLLHLKDLTKQIEKQ